MGEVSQRRSRMSFHPLQLVDVIAQSFLIATGLSEFGLELVSSPALSLVPQKCTKTS